MSVNPIVETTLRNDRLVDSRRPRPVEMAGPNGWAIGLIRGLASLKLTVFLMILAVLVILTFTFQLTQMDIWQAKSMHFPELFVFIPFQTFFPPKWFPNWQSVPGGFYIPSGFFILSALLVNLVAAHLTRFRVAGSRREVIVGLILTALGTSLAIAVILNGQNPLGFQARPPLAWTTLWKLIQAGFAACAAGSLFWGMRLGRQRTLERIALLAAGLFLASVFAFLAIRGSAAFIGDSAMRILWQMLQCLAPSLVILFGARQIFGRKAGMVLIHAGVAILMLNEIYTSLFAIEQRIQFFEGEQANYAFDLRHAELAIVDRSEPEQETHVAVPASLLVPGQMVQDPELPVDVMCLDYFRNSTIELAKPGDSAAIATSGIGRAVTLSGVAPVSGTGDAVDMPGAYVKLFDKQSKREIGTFAVGEMINRVSDDPRLPDNSFSLADRRYHLALRFKRYYKPYTLTLLDAEQENYLGTQMARSFSSKFRLVDAETGIDVIQTVWMNNPLRYRNETFYQASFDDSTGRDFSALQVVRNSGWMIPYFCCVLVGLGLVVQFGQTLIGHTRKLNQQMVQTASWAASRSGWTWLPLAAPTLIVVGGVYLAMKVTPPKDGMRMDLFGRIPIVHLGRAKPLDSVARSYVRRASGRESIKKDAQSRSSIAATTWLADAILGGQDYRQFDLYKVDDPNLRGGLNLKPASPYRYSIEQVEASDDVLRKIVSGASNLPEERRTEFDQRAIELGQLIRERRDMEQLLTMAWDGQQLLELYFRFVLPEANRPNAMLIAPLPKSEKGWGTLHTGLFCLEMIERARTSGLDTLSAAAQRVAEEQRSVVREHAIRQRLLAKLTTDESIREQAVGEMSAAEWQAFVAVRLASAPLSELESLAGPLVAEVEQDLDLLVARSAESIAEDLRRWLGTDQVSQAVVPGELRLLADLPKRYQSGDAQGFNADLTQYLSLVEASPPPGLLGWRLAFESVFNRVSPFFLAMVCYLLGFLIALPALVVWPGILNRWATATLLGGWLWHVVGIVMLVAISGRAPVTGLYSSFVFVACVVVGAFMAIERLTRMGFGNLLGGALGAGGLMWAWNIALGTEDTFAVLVAVLDTNFWLATHVICVSLGYAATLVAGAMGVTYVLGGLLTPWLTAPRRQELARFIYGTVCFGLLFSFVGTVLGGLWADDSWGRFWGWDPKENGALIIVLWNAVVLHARWGGLVKQRGMAALAVIGNVVTAWSWEGVNQLGVGLHAYALSDTGKFRMLVAFWLANLVIAALALIPPHRWLSQLKPAKDAPV
jgi:ABC-type transport system involved in cytochrome c biogenesis permease subunit